MRIRRRVPKPAPAEVTLVRYEVQSDRVYELWSDGTRTLLPCTVAAFLARAAEMMAGENGTVTHTKPSTY